MCFTTNLEQRCIQVCLPLLYTNKFKKQSYVMFSLGVVHLYASYIKLTAQVAIHFPNVSHFPYPAIYFAVTIFVYFLLLNLIFFVSHNPSLLASHHYQLLCSPLVWKPQILNECLLQSLLTRFHISHLLALSASLLLLRSFASLSNTPFCYSIPIQSFLYPHDMDTP